MNERLRTLFLYANGVGSRIVFVDTVLRGIFGYQDGDRPPGFLQKCYPKADLLFAELRDFSAKLSYALDWQDGFRASPQLDVEFCNINNLVHFGRRLLQLREYDLIVVGHTAAGDDLSVLLRAVGRFDRRLAPLVVFIGNEYDILDDKIAFIRQAGAEFVCTQLPLAAAQYLYGECASSRIVEMPHALNPTHYYPRPGVTREVDIGFVGDIYWPFVGDRERTELVEWFERYGKARGLCCDIRKERLEREAWSCFLGGCKAVIGAESGTYYLNDRGRLSERARAYNLFENREASFGEVFDRFFRDAPREVSGKSISSRHFEPIGTKTCQILIAGHYNGILEADRHYIALASDLGNIDDALRRFQDDRYRQQMVDETYDYVIAEHTYAHRISELIETVTGTNGVRVNGKSLTSAYAAALGEIETQSTLGRRGANLSASE